MAIACKFCIAEKGLKGSDIADLPQTDDEFIEHLESVHHMPVTRKGETDEQAQRRFIEKYPEAIDCPECQEANAPWCRRKA